MKESYEIHDPFLSFMLVLRGGVNLRERIERLAHWLKEQEADFAFINSVPNVFYLSNFSCNPMERLLGLIVFQEADPVMICPKLEEEQVKRAHWPFDIIGYTDNEDPWQLIQEHLAKKGIEQAQAYSIEEEVLTYARSQKLKEMYPNAHMIPIDNQLKAMRLIKTPDEIKRMKEATRLADYAIEVGVSALKEGVSELEVSAYITYRLRTEGIQGISSSPIVLFGEKSSLPHGVAGDRKLQKGDFVLFDLGVVVDGYYSDITRTFVYKEVTERQKEIYDAVLQSNLKAIEHCVVGTKIGKIDDLSREVIVEAGFGEYYPHRVGHGIGIEGHEHPSMNSHNESLLQEGMTFTVEPGIYIPGFGGVRIEDDVLVTKDGPEVLTSYRKDLKIID